MLNTEQSATLHGKMVAWRRSLDCLNVMEDLGENNTQILLHEDTKSDSNGTWRYYLSAFGFWHTFTSEPKTKSPAVTVSEKASATQLTDTVAASDICCWKSFMYDLITVDPKKAEARPI